MQADNSVCIFCMQMQSHSVDVLLVLRGIFTKRTYFSATMKEKVTGGRKQWTN